MSQGSTVLKKELVWQMIAILLLAIVLGAIYNSISPLDTDPDSDMTNSPAKQRLDQSATNNPSAQPRIQPKVGRTEEK